VDHFYRHTNQIDLAIHPQNNLEYLHLPSMGPHIEDKISHSKIEPNLSQWRVLDQESAPSHQGNYRGYVSDSQRSMTDLFELRFLFRNLLICIFLQFAIKENLAEIFKFFQSKQSRLFSIFNQIGLKNQFHRFQQNWIF